MVEPADLAGAGAEVRDVEVLVVGGGPAGLAAADAARRSGARVVLVEGGDDVGGQYWRHLPAERPAAAEAQLHHGWSTFAGLRRTLAGDPGCEVLTGASVWAVEPGAGALVVRVLVTPSGQADAPGRRHLALRPAALVVATGAHDLTLPFPGWDLPGVVTGGAAQAFAKSERLAVGERVVVAGAGPFLLPVASSLLDTGARVLEVAEAAGPAQLTRGWGPLLTGGGAGVFAAGLSGVGVLAGKTRELAGYVAALTAARVPYRTATGVVAARGDGRVEEVVLARLDATWAPVPGTERVVAADALAVSHGFTPRLEVALAAGAAVAGSGAGAGFVAVDDRGATSAPGVWAAGEVTGIGGADAALVEGALAGLAAAEALGHPAGPEVDGLLRRRRVLRAFADRLAAAHAPRPGWLAQVTDDTVVCRCEEVTAGRLRSVAQATASAADAPAGSRSLRLTTRAGLGPCQGRVCGHAVDAVLGCGLPASTGTTRPPVSHQRRPLAVPVRLGELADLPPATTPTSPATSQPTSEETP
ncbi:FAD-dependent oxidoreductase [Quadrisphaera setariae]|uniref:FAD-dependent oxidoreductase n=1 Tax=Quadrisphaera setariae TaxID=2593304 RepID=UPI001C9BF6BB|nr:FAD-dependent oxidoreductase [Quadrisphaera setariae]